MKIRNGFVSNSSSTSFIIMLPKNFDADKFIDNMEDGQIEHIIEEYDLYSFEPVVISSHFKNTSHRNDKITTKDQIKSILKQCVDNSGMYNDEKGYYMCTDLLGDFVVTSVDGGPDDGSISIMSEEERNRLKDLLFKEIRYDKLKKIENEN